MLIAAGGVLVLDGLRELRRVAWLAVRSEGRVVGPGGFEPPTTRL